MVLKENEQTVFRSVEKRNPVKNYVNDGGFQLQPEHNSDGKLSMK
jgi:hypothetical protein